MWYRATGGGAVYDVRIEPVGQGGLRSSPVRYRGADQASATAILSVTNGLLLVLDRVVDHVEPREHAMHDRPDDRLVGGPGDRDGESGSESDSRLRRVFRT